MSFVNLSREADILKDDTLVTSGYGGVYPRGLLVGHVSEVTDDPSTPVRRPVWCRLRISAGWRKYLSL